MSLLHDREVGPEVGVEDGVEPHPPEGGVGLAGEVRADREAEGLADGDSDRRRELSDAVDVRVQEVVPDFLRIVVFDDGARRAMRRALAAAHARRVGEVDVARGGDAGVEATLEEAQGPDVLDLLADLDAAAASDALARIENDGLGRVVDRQVGHDAVQADFAQTEVRGERLEFAVLVAPAGQAFVGMPGQDHLDHRPADLNDLRVLGRDLHVLLDRRAAGAKHLGRACDADDAHAAGGRRIQVRVLAQSRDVDGDLACGVEDGGALGDLNGEAVDRGLDHVGHGWLSSCPRSVDPGIPVRSSARPKEPDWGHPAQARTARPFAWRGPAA